MGTYKPSEGKREEFRKYLEKNGVMDALTKALVCLYEEVDKPDDALEYIRDKLSTLAGQETYKQLSEKLQQAEDRIKELEQQLEASSEIKEDQENAADEEQAEPKPEPAEENVEQPQPPPEEEEVQ